MQAIGDYTNIVKMALVEGGKYFLLLFLLALTVRFWRFARASTAATRPKAMFMFLICLVGLLTLGGTAITNSLSHLYSAYGREAFRHGDMNKALKYFVSARRCWKNADTAGEEGVSRLLLGQGEVAMPLMAEAKLRRGHNTPFEEFYGGLFFFLNDSPDRALSFLQPAATDQRFQWDATKLMAVILIEKGRVGDAIEIMRPFAGVEVKDCDHAYVMALLDLQNGHKAEARAVMQDFSPQKLGHFWQVRFEKLRKQTFES